MTKCNGIEIWSVWSMKNRCKYVVYEKKAANKRACANLFATLLLLLDLNSQIYGCKLSATITRPSPSWPSMLRERRGHREL